MTRALVLLLALAAVPSSAGVGDGFGLGAVGGGAASGGATITYPVVNVQVGGYVSVSPTVTGGSSSSWSVTGGTLPDGLTINALTGEIYGSVTTTALQANTKRAQGASSDMGEHTFAVTAAGLDVTASVTINVYAMPVPAPQALLVFSSEFVSGSNFTDANGLGTWTKAAGTTDTDLTDALSPLGYAHKFDGSTHFTGPAVTVSSPHATVAFLARDFSRTSGTLLQVMASFGTTAGSTKGMWSGVSPTVCNKELSAGSGAATVVAYASNDCIYSTRVYSVDNGVGRKFFKNGTKDTAIVSDTTLFDISGATAPHVGRYAELAGYNYFGAISEVAYWPRVLDDTQAISVDWAWNRGISLDDWTGVSPQGTVTITPTAPAYERPVTCTGSYTLTGSTTNADVVTWSALPGGEQGTCTGTSSYSCTISISPDVAGEGVETISIAAYDSEGTGIAVARQDIGFYVAGARDCFLSQSIDGASNTTNVDNDAVTTWVNLISSDRNITQGTAGARPTVQEGIGSGVYVQPLVRFDGGDFLCDDTAADHVGYHNGTDFHVNVVAATTSTNPAKISHLFTTRNTTATTTLGMALTFDDSSANDACRISIGDGSSNIILGTCSASALVSGKYHEIAFTLDDDGAGGTDGVLYGNGSSLVTPTRAGSYSASNPTSALCLGNESGGGAQSLTGDIFAAIGYAGTLTSTQRGINTAVTTWALGNSLPVSP